MYESKCQSEILDGHHHMTYLNIHVEPYGENVLKLFISEIVVRFKPNMA